MSHLISSELFSALPAEAEARQRVAENDSEKFVCCQDDCALTQIVAIKTPFPMFLNKSKLLLIIFVHILYFKPTGFSEVSENELKLAQNI